MGSGREDQLLKLQALRAECAVRVLQLEEDRLRLADQYQSFLAPDFHVGSSASTGSLRRFSAGGHEFSDSYHSDICMASSREMQIAGGSSLPPHSVRVPATTSGRPIRSLSRLTDKVGVEGTSQGPLFCTLENSHTKQRKQRKANTAPVKPCTSALRVREGRRHYVEDRPQRPQKSSWPTRFSVFHGRRCDAKVGRSDAFMQTLHKPSQTESIPVSDALQLVSTGQQTAVSTVATLASCCMELLSRGIISLPRRDNVLPSLRGHIAASYPSFFSKSDLTLLVRQLPWSRFIQEENSLGLWGSTYLPTLHFQRRPLWSLPATEVPCDLDSSDSGKNLHNGDPFRLDVDHVSIEEVTIPMTIEEAANANVCQVTTLSEPMQNIGVTPSSDSPGHLNVLESVAVRFQKLSANVARAEHSGPLHTESDRLSWY
ncbi:unnamed protein product [Schistocephalus solidus]|uniref:Uncharacterized protein n=1 Tax=Schistocephalus solidus TaxID=70667 RepID=A0A183S9H3_SCHSO|nr:unnamed protein product [Schistocephalus solidus]